MFSAVPNSAAGYCCAGNVLSLPAACCRPVLLPTRSRRSCGTPSSVTLKLLGLFRAAGGSNRTGSAPSPATRQVPPARHTGRPRPPARGYHGAEASLPGEVGRAAAQPRSSTRPWAVALDGGGRRLRKRRGRTCPGPAQSRSRMGKRMRGCLGPAQ